MANSTIIKTFKILDLIANSNDDLTASDMSKKLKIPSSTIHDILKTLLQENVIYYKDFNKKTYNIGIRAFAMSKNYLEDSNIVTISKNYIRQVCDAYNINGYILKPVNNGMMVTHNYESKGCLIKICNVGYQFNRGIYGTKRVHILESELNSNIYQACVPLFDYTNEAVGEIKLVGLKNDILEHKIEIENILVGFSNQISLKLGSSPELAIRIYK